MYKIALKTEGPNSYQLTLPVNPEEMTFGRPGKAFRYDLLGQGEVVIPRGQGLKTVTISSVFPGDGQGPAALAAIENMIAAREPLRLIITQDQVGDSWLQVHEENFPVVITGFNYLERGGEIGTIFYDLELTEYRPFKGEVLD